MAHEFAERTDEVRDALESMVPHPEVPPGGRNQFDLSDLDVSPHLNIVEFDIAGLAGEVEEPESARPATHRLAPGWWASGPRPNAGRV